jgi:hypothetical protein
MYGRLLAEQRLSLMCRSSTLLNVCPVWRIIARLLRSVRAAAVVGDAPHRLSS